MSADEDLHRHAAENLASADALLFGRVVWFLAGYRAAVPVRQLAFSMAALVTGLAYLAGTKIAWGALSSAAEGGE